VEFAMAAGVEEEGERDMGGAQRGSDTKQNYRIG
jgi:hypothetical protein